MPYINYILDDESIDDKILTKELSLFIANHRKNNLPVNKAFIDSLINITFQNSEVNFNGFGTYFDPYFMMIWFPKDMFLGYDINKLLGYSKKLKKDYFKSKVGDSKIFTYFWLLSSILHEVTHVRQEYVKRKSNNEIYVSTTSFIFDEYENYIKNHDIMLNERYANLRGSMLAYSILSYIYPIDQIKEIRKLIFSELFTGYKIENDGIRTPASRCIALNKSSKIITALDSYNELMEESSRPKLNIDYPSDTGLYDRFYLGLYISPDEYNKLSDIYRNIYYYGEPEEDVKTLIMK